MKNRISNNLSRDPIDLEFLERKPKVQTERKRVLLAFGDITDFGQWTRRGSNSPEEFKAFMVDVYKEFINFKNGCDLFIKLMGDGLMAVRELEGHQNGQMILDVLKRVYRLKQSIERIIEATQYPRPTGFRIRVVLGHVWKVEASHLKDTSKKQIDYLGYSVNLTSRLLEVARHEPCLCHESVKELLNGKIRNSGLKFDRLKKPDHCPRGVDPEDLQALWVFRINGH